MRKLLSLSDFRKTVGSPLDVPAAERSAKHQSPDLHLCASFPATVKAADPDKRQLIFTISDETLDRHGDVVSVDGWELENFLRNPVMLAFHDYATLPVAKATEVWREGKALKALTEWPSAELSPFADRVYRYYLEGYLHAVSVGFSALEWSWVEDADRFGINFLRQELLEFSAVSVPANPNALSESAAPAKANEPDKRIPDAEEAAASVDADTIQRLVDFEQEMSRV